MASIRQHGKTWRVQLKVGGRRDSGTFPTKREATLWAERRSIELRRARDGTLGEVKTLRDALRRYRDEVAPTHKGERWETVRIDRLLKDGTLPLTLPLDRLTGAQLTAWKLERLRAVSAGSVLREMSLLGSVLSHARRDWQWMQHAPLADVRRPRQPAHRDRVLTWLEVRRMLRQLGWRARSRPETMKQVAAAAFLMSLRAGMRAGEIVGLEWGRVRPSWVELPDTKNGTARSVPLSARAVVLLERLRGLDEDRPFPIGAQTLDALFRKARQDAGLSGFRFHDARHTAATRIGRIIGQPGKISFPEFCLIFGWRDPKHALIYVNPSAADLADRM